MENSEAAAPSRKVVLITGATGAIGYAIARRIAKLRDFDVVLACRDQLKAQRCVDQIQQQTANSRVRYEMVDLANAQSIQELANRWRGPLHILVNDAAIAPKHRQETSEGIELQFATNVLGYFRLTRVFEEILSRSAPARIVNVASYWAGGLAIEDLEFKNRHYDNDSAYRQSKQANRMLTVADAKKFKPKSVTVNCCHPGDVHSTLSHDLEFGGSDSADEAANTPVWLATTQAGAENTGNYFEYQKQVTCRFSSDSDAVTRLYQTCLQYG